MSKFKSYSTKSAAQMSSYQENATTNFNMGTSYRINPLDNLRMIAASSIFGETSYYRDSHDCSAVLKKQTFLGGLYLSQFDGKTTTQVFSEAIDIALSYNFLGTLNLALRLRTEYLMRLNPAVIAVRAALHPQRIEFNRTHGGYMRKILGKLILRPDDITNQFEYYMFLRKKKNNLPSLLKRVWSDRLSCFKEYALNKYASKSLIDLVRISHAKSPFINELMKTGKVSVPPAEQTYQQLRSAGKSWEEIIGTIQIPHMALLRNLAGIFSKEKISEELAAKILEELKKGVLKGKQFPYRYFSAYNAILQGKGIQHKHMVLDCLEKCMDIALANFPKLSGKTISVCDNSGSTQFVMTTEYGIVSICNIANLSGVMTAMNADEGEGYVGVFADHCQIIPITKSKGILAQHSEVSQIGKRQGCNTKIAPFFDEAINSRTFYQNIFIYSDMQVTDLGVLSMIEKYRSQVNPKVNVFTIQIAGYDNTILPENLYRTAILTGWTGKEALYSKEMISLWDEQENKRMPNKTD